MVFPICYAVIRELTTADDLCYAAIERVFGTTESRCRYHLTVAAMAHRVACIRTTVLTLHLSARRLAGRLHLAISRSEPLYHGFFLQS